MKKRLVWILLFTATLLLAGCGAKESEDALLSLPEGFALMETGDVTYDLLKNGEIVGGVVRYELLPLEEGEERYPVILQELGIFDFDDPPAAYMLSSSKYGEWQLTHGTLEQEFSHEFFLFDTYMYDLWVDRSCIDAEDEEMIVADFAENILPELS